MNLRPSEIYFTQASISRKFGRCTTHKNKTIGETLDDLAEERIGIGSIPNICVMKENGKWWTADNRRLWIFRHLEKLGKCTEIPVDTINSIDSRKRTSKNGGIDVYIFKGRNPGGFWHSKVDSINNQDTSEPKDINKDVFNIPVVPSHANSQIRCTTDGILSDSKLVECNDHPVKPVEPNTGSLCITIKSDSISRIFKSEAEKMKHCLNGKPLNSGNSGMKMDFIPLEKSPSLIPQTKFVVSNTVCLQNTSDFLPKRSSPHHSIRYTPYERVRKYSSIGISKQTLACTTTSRTYTTTMLIGPIRSTLGNYKDTGHDLEDEYEYCNESESDISDESQSSSSGESSEDSDEGSSDDSDKEGSGDLDNVSSDESYYDDNSSDWYDAYSDDSDNEWFNYSPKKYSNNAFKKGLHNSAKAFQHSDRESSYIVYDSFHNSVDEFRCYAYLSKGFDDEDSCDSESSAESNVGDHKTAVLDRAYLDGCYNSDVDNMIYDYID
ncbi:unnamed protein product [Mytilus edulis]|uniref:Uncharacterized protein n=1 Tax=Mytilus edulis TaxID=6550 RepID=A0A8S3SHG9_MYTED|nr:unnamed protein product [Mytilus edulis]